MSAARSSVDGPTHVGVIGLGSMGRAHLEAYGVAADAGCPNRLVAVCSRDGKVPTESSGNLNAGSGPLFDPAEVRHYSDVEHMLREADLDLVSICTPTDTHVELASLALRAGVHVLLEKPVALTAGEVAQLCEVARSSGCLCMPAMCMRFWPGWRWLKDAIERGAHGPVESAEFRRLGSAPSWSRDFYGDLSRSGGALFDLHVHDADFVLWLFGEPASVTSRGSQDHVTTSYHYPGGPSQVSAEGSWEQPEGSPFHMSYRVVFERATAEFLFGREPTLLLTRDGVTEPVEVPAGTGYPGEVRHLLEAIATGAEQLDATLEEALTVTRMLAAEHLSLTSGETIQLEQR